MMVRLIMLLLIVLFSFHKGVAQKIVVSQVINKCLYEGAIPAFDNYLNDISRLRYHLPFVEEINFRTETDQFHLGRQEYALRTIFNSWGESSAYAKDKEHHLSLLLLIKEKKEAELLHQIMDDISKRKTIAFTLPLIDSLIQHHQHKLRRLMDKALLGEDVQARDILREEEEVFGYKEKKQTLLIQEEQLSIKVKTKQEIDWSDWINLSTMQKVIDSIHFDGLDLNSAQRYTLLKSQNEWKYKAERANDKRILDFAQLRYSKRDNLLFQDEFSVGLGIRWPYKGSSIKEKNALLEKNSLLDVELEVQKNNGQEKFNNLKQTFNSLLRQHAFYTENVNKIFTVLNDKLDENAVELKTIRNEHRLTARLKQVELEDKITSTYLDLLYLNGSFGDNKKINYLSIFLLPF